MSQYHITNAARIGWNTDCLSIEQISSILGWSTEQLMNWSLSAAVCRASGAWDANDRERHAAYKSLEKILRGAR